MDINRKNAMAKIKYALLGAGLALTVGLAAAGPATWPLTAQNAIDYPDCGKAAGLMQHTADAGEHTGWITADQTDADAQDALIAEYLSFHAQVVEDGGKLSLVPGSLLRTHSN
jgi:hypothetical protein